MDISLRVHILVFPCHHNVWVSRPRFRTAAHLLSLMYIHIDFLLKKETRHIQLFFLLSTGCPKWHTSKRRPEEVFSWQTRGRKGKVKIPNKQITKWQLCFDVLFLTFFWFSKYICLETTIKLLSTAASREKKELYGYTYEKKPKLLNMLIAKEWLLCESESQLKKRKKIKIRRLQLLTKS